MIKKTIVDAYKMNVLSLAFLGDAIHSMYVREKIVCSGDYKQKDMQEKSSSIVRASSQAKTLDSILHLLNDKEADIVRRARNAKTNNIAKNSTIEDYKKSTAYEALIGYLYVSKEEKRMLQFLEKSLEDNV